MIDVGAVRRRMADDSGTTLLELVVGMVVMGIFMAMFTVAMLTMTNTTNNVQVLSDTSNQATDAFLRLDREVRYASAIGTPAFDATSGMWHVEFATGVITRDDGNAVSNSSQCTQLAISPPSAPDGSAGLLEQRTWTVGDANPGAWAVIANSVTNYGASDSTSPFPPTTSISGDNASTSMQQLTVRLMFSEAPVSSTTTTSSYTFTALNSSTSNTTPVCQQFAVGSPT